jgi:hypothetical protein
MNRLLEWQSHGIEPDSRPVPLCINQRLGGSALTDLAEHPVSDYAVPRLEPLCYPGGRPGHGFTLVDGLVLPARAAQGQSGPAFGVKTPEGIMHLDDLLEARNVALMADRIPVVSFGSNGSPSQLAYKYAPQQNKQGYITNPGDHVIVPTLTGTMCDVAAAYSSRLGVYGYVFAEMIEAPGATTHVSVNFLSPDQHKQMMDTEQNYEFCDLGQVCLDGLEKPITAYGFAGKNEIMLDAEGRPILLESIHTTGYDAPSMTEEQVLDMLAADCGGRFDALYPNAPVFASSAAHIAALISYRVEFLRRTSKNKTIYKNPSPAGEPEQLLVSEAFRSILKLDGRVSKDKLLDLLPPERRNVVPATFGELY